MGPTQASMAQAEEVKVISTQGTTLPPLRAADIRRMGDLSFFDRLRVKHPISASRTTIHAVSLTREHPK